MNKQAIVDCRENILLLFFRGLKYYFISKFAKYIGAKTMDQEETTWNIKKFGRYLSNKC